MTAHGSKGQEFEYVFIMNAVDRKWGSRSHKESIKLPTKIYRGVADSAMAGGGDADVAADDEDAKAADALADERNVLRGATRARKELFVTMAKNDRDGKEQLPTQFIAELAPEILAPLDVNAYEKDFAEIARRSSRAGTSERGRFACHKTAGAQRQGIFERALSCAGDFRHGT